MMCYLLGITGLVAVISGVSAGSVPQAVRHLTRHLSGGVNSKRRAQTWGVLTPLDFQNPYITGLYSYGTRCATPFGVRACYPLSDMNQAWSSPQTH